MRFATTCVSLSALLYCLVSPAAAEDWPQFRGRNSSGRATTTDPLPTEIGPETNVLWKTALPPGHSSPAIVGDRIYLTAVRDEQLLTLCLDRGDGRLLWEAIAPHETLESIHGIGSYAQPSPAADGERVVSFFGSSGLYCYDCDGQPLWNLPMGPFNNDFGAGSSPIVVDDYVVLCQDHDSDSFLLAIDKRTGETVWRTDRSEFARNYCTPVVWEVDGRKQLVVAATLRVVGYDLATGEELWTVRGIARTVCMTPVVGDDGLLYAAGWSAGGDAGERIALDPFEQAAAHDGNGNGALEEGELPEGSPVRIRFTQVDRDNDQAIDRAEYDFFRRLFDESRNVVMAIRPGGRGDVTSSHVAWQYDRFVPFCASPLYTGGLVFTIKDGGILSCLDAESGEALKQERLGVSGAYYASPVAGDGKVYLANQDGDVTVVGAAEDWEELHTASFDEGIYATPALVDGRVYLRTTGHLYCFGVPAE